MTYRITPSVLFQRALFDVTGAYARFARAQNQISTGRRIRVFSDDPSAASRALDLRTTIAKTAQSRESVTSARLATDSQAAILEEVSTLIIDARARAEEAANGSKSPSDLAAIASEINSILDQVVGRANQTLEGRYLFAGSRIDTTPFQITKSFESIISVNYVGDDITRKVRLGPADVKDVDLSGRDAFLSYIRGDTTIAGSLGLVPSVAANDTMVGDEKLVVAHTSTVIGDGLGPGGGDALSGIVPGLSTAADTIIGTTGTHRLTVAVENSGEYTIRLDDGTSVPLDITKTDLTLTNVAGEKIHVDLTGMTPGFTGTIDLVGNGQIQGGGGTPQTLTFTSDFVLQDGAGRVVHLDTTGLHGAGESLAVFPGTESVFEVLISLRDEIEGNSGFSSVGREARIQSILGALDRDHQGILGALAKLGARSASFDRIANSLSLFELSLEEKRGDLEDADIFQASLDLSQAENAYQAALMAASKLNGPSLLNYM
ncbi:MAG: flagellar hook-associated protein FlgL [Planctomycetota bacterium]